MISAITRGWRRGRRRRARPRVTATTRQIWRMMRGRAKSRGLSFCHAPFDVAFICPKPPTERVLFLDSGGADIRHGSRHP
ncbi:unnamed protein product [Spirodela intermedia]|uniref:Uncharacterized protein n=1 Tax=Spirodela intermedia TaxID=51605 RepID=A0A7I8JFX3_SPIIN|nr:unnamed protein product [Spirodela intermedia]CAA6668841.1 unnamed protein product [Spirodela intermedia]